jgi:hypothetical protein
MLLGATSNSGAQTPEPGACAANRNLGSLRLNIHPKWNYRSTPGVMTLTSGKVSG